MQKYIVEALGTFFLTFAVSFTSFTGNPIPIGLMFMAMIYIGFHISGAHYNPAVSLANFVQKRISLQNLLIYIVSQCLGALAALGLFTALTDVVFSPEIPLEAPLALSMGLEMLLSFVLILTILTVTLLDRYRGHVQGIVMGFTLLALVSIGGIFNPAIALAAILFNMLKDGSFVGVYHAAVYVAGPCIASLIASYSYQFLNENR